MKIFMDTADVKEIAEFADLGVVYGVTTNPSLIAKTGRTQAEVIPEICKLIPGIYYSVKHNLMIVNYNSNLVYVTVFFIGSIYSGNHYYNNYGYQYKIYKLIVSN